LVCSAQSANILVTGAANVNCPIVDVSPSTSVHSSVPGTPDKYSLSQNYPNPFNPSTTVNFSLVNGELVILKVYNSIGEEAAELINEFLPAGNYKVNFSADGLTSGVYLLKLSAGTFNATRKIVLLR